MQIMLFFIRIDCFLFLAVKDALTLNALKVGDLKLRDGRHLFLFSVIENVVLQKHIIEVSQFHFHNVTKNNLIN